MLNGREKLPTALLTVWNGQASARTVSNPTDQTSLNVVGVIRRGCSMSLRDVSETSACGAIPHCFLCHRRLSVRPLGGKSATDGVRYWTCDDCEVAWATADGKTLTSTAAERSPRKSA